MPKHPVLPRFFFDRPASGNGPAERVAAARRISVTSPSASSRERRQVRFTFVPTISSSIPVRGYFAAGMPCVALPVLTRSEGKKYAPSPDPQASSARR